MLPFYVSFIIYSREEVLMRPVLYPVDGLVDLLRARTVAAMPQLMAALGTATRRTVVRKLAQLPHLTSYSHAGGFYALPESARFDRHGLWSFGSVHFSSRGTLLATAEALASAAPAGRFVEELDALLHVVTANALRQLAGDRRLARVKVAGRFLYCAPEPDLRRRQLLARRVSESTDPPPPDTPPRADLDTARQRFLGQLDQRQRRLYSGLASLESGHGGDRRAAVLTGLHPSTVARGRRELLDQAVLLPRGQVRRPGGGRQALEKKTLH